jgi:YVTN family beta-propeller protein
MLNRSSQAGGVERRRGALRITTWNDWYRFGLVPVRARRAATPVAPASPRRPGSLDAPPPLVPPPAGKAPQAVVVADGSVFVANQADGTISRINPTTATLIATLHIGHHPTGDRSQQASYLGVRGLSGRFINSRDETASGARPRIQPRRVEPSSLTSHLVARVATGRCRACVVRRSPPGASGSCRARTAA